MRSYYSTLLQFNLSMALTQKCHAQFLDIITHRRNLVIKHIGIIEAVESLLLSPHEDKLYIPSIAYESELFKSLADYLSVLNTLNVEPPIFIFLDLFGVRGYSMALRERFWDIESHKIDRDVLILPEIIIENYDSKVEEVLKPALDSIWNACGLARSLNYDEDGNWVGRQ